MTDPASVPLRVSALDDRQPLGEVARAAFGEQGRLKHPGEGALVGAIGAEKIWLLETEDDRLCVLVVREQYGSAGVDCHPRSDLLGPGVLSAHWGSDTKGPVAVIVVAPDGYTTARAQGIEAPFDDNTAVLAFADRPRAAERLTISGPGLPEVAFVLKTAIGYDPPAPGEDTKIYHARQALTDLSDSARVYAKDHGGSTSGFVAGLPANFRARLDRSRIRIDDTSASVAVNGRCLRIELATGVLTDRAC